MVYVVAVLFVLCSLSLVSVLGFSVIRTALPKARLISVYPSRFIPSRKSELLYIPSPLSQRIFNDASAVLEDNHFVSHVSDCGYPIHTLELSQFEHSANYVETCVGHALDHLMASHNHIVLIANELSSLHLLRIMCQDKNRRTKEQIQGLVMIDPPPLHSIQTEYGRRRILEKLATPDSLIFPPMSLALPSALAVATPPDSSTTTGVQKHSTPATLSTENVAVTQEELDYYDFIIRRQRAGSRRAMLSAVLPRKRNKLREFLNGPKPHRSVPTSAIHSQMYNAEQLTPTELRERVIIALESGILSTTSFLGEDVLHSVEKVKDMFGAEKVLVIGTSGTGDTHSRDNTSSMNNGGVDRDGVDGIHTSSSSNADSDSTDSAVNFMYDEASLFSAADDWGAASMNETAGIFSAYPVHYTHCTSSSGDSDHHTAEYGVWPEKDVHQNKEIARAIDIFVRNLAQ